MNTYQLISENTAYNKFGTAKEIWEHVRTLGYEGDTTLVDGFPLPSGKGFSIENSHFKRSTSLRVSHAVWAKVDGLLQDLNDPKLKTRVDVILRAIDLLEDVQRFGKVYATTPDGTQAFKSLREVIGMYAYFDNFDFQPTISQNKENLPE
ncbi:MAG: hypothetical protein AAF587_22765 [Bacteroidota bacterium]